MNEKVVGYLLMAFGVGIILFSAFSAYRVFSGADKPIALFAADSISFDVSTLMGEGPQLDSAGQAPQIEILNQKVINTALNSIFHLILMFFMVTVGAKLATLGTLLVRTINVDLKSSNKLNAKTNV